MNEKEKPAFVPSTSLSYAISPHNEHSTNLLSQGGIHAWRHVAVDHMQLSPGLRILEVGCKTGIATRLIASRLGKSGQVIGMDPAPEMLAVCREGVTTAGSAPIEWLLGSGEHLPFEDGVFDRVTAQFSLHGMTDWATGLQEMLRVLKPMGQLTILDMVQPRTAKGIGAREALDAITAKIARPSEDPSPWVNTSWDHAPTVEEMREEVLRLGLRQLTIRQWLGDLVVVLTGTKEADPSHLQTWAVPAVVIWAVNGSLTSLRAAPWINHFVAGGTTIHLATVLPESLYAEQIQQTDRLFWLQQHSSARNLLTPERFNVEVTILEGMPGPALVELAVNRHAKMIVMGNKHRKILSDYWQENTARYVSMHSPVPVVLVPTELTQN